MDGTHDNRAKPSGFRVGAFTLSIAEGQLCRGRERIPLGMRAVALLRALLESSSHAATRSDLIRRVWPGRIVEETNLSVQISALRKALGRDAIVTSYGRGYRLTLHVEAIGAERRRAIADGRPPMQGNLADHKEPATSFIGRSGALAAMAGKLASTRLLTLVGAGGIGKTRLALRLASSLASEQTVLVVNAASLQAMQELDDAVARSLERRRTSSAPWQETFPTLLAGRDVCLVLDNCEHLATECARLINEITALCPTVRVLATSRVRLFVPGETIFEVAPLALLALPGAETPMSSEATQLFIARAEVAEIALAPDDEPDIVQICRSVDGVPLAIELAAAWLPLLSVHEIATRLQRDLRLLDAGPAPPSRHHTMEATIRWSYSMLQSEEQETFRQLSVFSSGCTTDAAIAVCGEGRDEYATLRCIAKLQEFSLLMKRGRRLSMLEPVRQFAVSELIKAGEEPELHRRHLRYYRALAERHRSGDRAAHYALLEPDRDNLRIAQQRSLFSDDLRSCVDLVMAFHEYWADTGRIAEAASFASAALAVAGENTDRGLRSAAHMIASRYATYLGNPGAALYHGEQALALARELNDTRHTVNALDAMTWAQVEAGQATQALATALQSRELAVHSPAPAHVYMAENTIGELQRLIGNFAEAETAFGRVVVLARGQQDFGTVSIALVNLGLVLVAQQDFSRLPAVLLESADAGHRCGMHRALPYLCRAAAALALQINDHACAARLLGGAAGQIRVMQLTPSHDDRKLDDAIARELESTADRALIALEMAAGARLPREALWRELVTWLRG